MKCVSGNIGHTGNLHHVASNPWALHIVNELSTRWQGKRIS